MENIFLEGLNDRQRAAATSVTGATLVIAGAGSGKTAVLTRRAAYLIACGAMPGSILSVTFTNKAAREMRERVNGLLSKAGMNLPQVMPWMQDYVNAPLLSTFHSLGVRILREFGEKIGLKKEFSILDIDDQKKLIRNILKEMNISDKVVNPKLVSYFISNCKQELLEARESKKVSKEFLPIFHQIYAKYEDFLRISHVLDFDDLLLKTYVLMRDDSETLEILRDRWKHIQVDEFQDTNKAQFEIIRLLCPPELLSSARRGNADVSMDNANYHTNQTPKIKDSGLLEGASSSSRSLFVVGDDAQSIYAFRGSKIEIILNFEEQYPGVKEIILNQNYRSTQPILDLAEKVLTHNSNQKKKDLFTENKEKLDVRYYTARNEKDEAEFIVKKLYDLYVNKKGTEFEGEQNSEQTPKIKDFDPLEGVGDFNFSNNSEITFESDEDGYKNEDSVMFSSGNSNLDSKESSSLVSSMFDVYLDINEASPKTSISSFQPTSFLPKANWKKVEKLNDVAILYRTHSQSRALEEAFLKNHIPYKLVSGVKFLSRKEIKDVLAILKFMVNGSDKMSLTRFLPLIMEGVGPKTMQKILAYLEDYEFPLPPKYAQALLEVMSKMQNCWLNSDNLIDFTKELLVVTGYMRYLKSEYPAKEEFEARVENIGEIYSLMLDFDQDKEKELSERLSEFLNHVSLMTSEDLSEDSENSFKISLMSLHQSKGLEYETVFLAGCEDGLLPHQNSLMEPGGLEEEVRLAYVGVTRAKKHLFLLSADSRVQFGQIKAYPVSRIFRPFLDSHAVRVRR